MTLPELAALAAERVPGFRRPTRKCEWCGGVKWGNRLEPCDKCDDNGRVLDDSPAALAMAVLVYLRWCRGDYEVVGPLLSVSVYHVAGAAPFKRGCAVIKGDIPDYVAHAYLTALLRAHGVEVAE